MRGLLRAAAVLALLALGMLPYGHEASAATFQVAMKGYAFSCGVLERARRVHGHVDQLRHRSARREDHLRPALHPLPHAEQGPELELHVHHGRCLRLRLHGPPGHDGGHHGPGCGSGADPGGTDAARAHAAVHESAAAVDDAGHDDEPQPCGDPGLLRRPHPRRPRPPYRRRRPRRRSPRRRSRPRPRQRRPRPGRWIRCWSWPVWSRGSRCCACCWWGRGRRLRLRGEERRAYRSGAGPSWPVAQFPGPPRLRVGPTGAAPYGAPFPRYLRIFARAPHTCMEHQRPRPAGLRS